MDIIQIFLLFIRIFFMFRGGEFHFSYILLVCVFHESGRTFIPLFYFLPLLFLFMTLTTNQKKLFNMLENDVLRRVYMKKICIPLYNNIYIEYSFFLWRFSVLAMIKGCLFPSTETMNDGVEKKIHEYIFRDKSHRLITVYWERAFSFVFWFVKRCEQYTRIVMPLSCYTFYTFLYIIHFVLCFHSHHRLFFFIIVWFEVPWDLLWLIKRPLSACEIHILL